MEATNISHLSDGDSLLTGLQIPVVLLPASFLLYIEASGDISICKSKTFSWCSIPEKYYPSSLSDLQNPSRPTPILLLQFHLSLFPHPLSTELTSLLFLQVLRCFTSRPSHMLFLLTGAFFLSPLSGKPTHTHSADFNFNVTFSRRTSLEMYLLKLCIP